MVVDALLHTNWAALGSNRINIRKSGKILNWLNWLIPKIKPSKATQAGLKNSVKPH